VDFPVSCSEDARTELERAIALLHHMTYPQAREAFETVAQIDPRCAMAHWGIAMTLFQPLWPTRPGSEDLRRGWEAVQSARALAPPTERERLFVDAAAAFFQEPASADYWSRIRRWETAMETLHAAYPEDPEATTFYALAHLAAAPPGELSPERTERAAQLLLGVYEGNPDHPGAMHYLVHANDAPGRERESLDIVRRYQTVAPHNPHALHMPTHIFTRLGDWDAVIAGNLRAAEAALEHPAGSDGELVWDEFPHAIEYLVYACLQKGSDEAAAAHLQRLLATSRLQPTFKTAFHLASTQARYAVERRAWAEAAQLIPRRPATLDWDRFTWPEAVTWLARGLGAARLGDLAEARRAGARLAELEEATSAMGEDLFARQIAILGLEVDAWVAHLQGDGDAAVELMGRAVALEASTPKHAVTPAPTLPASELLGDLLLERARPAEALVAFQRSLELYPRRLNSVLGAARAARALGDPTASRAFYRQVLELADAGTRRPVIEEARREAGRL
jgi:tetratricopeptide (TPR) repeat protein